jgi:hypothetical protein
MLDLWEIQKEAIRRKDPIAFLSAFYAVAPAETVGIPFAFAVTFYVKFYAPWRHGHFPYTEKQVSWREKFGIRLKPPYSTTRIILPIFAVSAILDKIGAAMKSRSRKS